MLAELHRAKRSLAHGTGSARDLSDTAVNVNFRRKNIQRIFAAYNWRARSGVSREKEAVKNVGAGTAVLW